MKGRKPRAYGSMSVEKPPPLEPKNTEVLDFEVIEEYWNEYELEDDTKLRGRTVLTRATRPRLGAVAGRYDLSFNHIFTVTAAPDQRGKPGPPLSSEEITVKPDDISSGVKIPVRLISHSEPWNIYRIEKTMDMFQVKLVVNAVYRAKDRFDQFGEPAYVVTNSVMIAPVAKGYVKIEPAERRKTRK